MRRAALLLGTAAAVVAGCGPQVGRLSIPVPPPSRPVATTAPPSTVDGSAVSLPTVPGVTTTTAPGLGPGGATVTGTVRGPGGPVAGATVLVQRVVGARAASTEVATAASGKFTVAGVLGGLYRLRAWDPPHLTMLQAVLRWVPDGTTQSVELTLASFGPQLAVTASFDPDPPVVGRPVILAVLVRRPSVTAGGLVRDVPATGSRVRLLGASWTVSGPATATTGPTGTVTFVVTCHAAGSQALGAVVGVGRVSLHPPACVAPAPPPTSVPKTKRHRARHR